MADATEVLGATYTTILALNLLLMVGNTWLLSRRPIFLHLREIYFINSNAFRRAWYLVIAGMSLFLVARSLEGLEARHVLAVDGRAIIFDVAFAALLLAAFLELVFVFGKYIPYLRADDADVLKAIQADLRNSVVQIDEVGAMDINVSIAENIYSGRPQLGPNVSLSHYRAVVLGITQYMEHRFGELGDAMLHSVGRQTGRHAAEGMREDGSNLDDFLHAVQASNVGIATISQKSDARVTLRLDECAVCAGIQPSGNPECHYLTGLFRGVMEVFWRTPVESTETRCHSKGDLYCEFQIDQANT